MRSASLGWYAALREDCQRRVGLSDRMSTEITPIVTIHYPLQHWQSFGMMTVIPYRSGNQNARIKKHPHTRYTDRSVCSPSSRTSSRARSQSTAGCAAPRCTQTPLTFAIVGRCSGTRNRNPSACLSVPIISPRQIAQRTLSGNVLPRDAGGSDVPTSFYEWQHCRCRQDFAQEAGTQH